MEDLLSQLHDIKGLDAINWWPLAPGWWGLFFVLLAICTAVYFYRRYKERKAASLWEQTKSLFEALRSKPDQDAKEKIAALSELIRRVAIRKHGRDACAGREGKEWLAWLTKHDPENFDWQRNAGILIEAPYMPDGTVIANDDIEQLIEAAERWMK